jgi:hypothetical protein
MQVIKSPITGLELHTRAVFSTAHMPEEENKQLRETCRKGDPRFESLWEEDASDEFKDTFVLPYASTDNNIELIRSITTDFPHLAIVLMVGILAGVCSVSLDGDGTVYPWLKTYDW